MATSALGVCTICGQKKNVKTVRGDKCCSNCSPLYHAVHGKGAMLLQLMLRVHGEKWLNRNWPVKQDPETNNDSADIADMRESKLHLEQDVARLEDANRHLNDEVAALQAAKEAQREKIESLKLKLDIAEGNVGELKASLKATAEGILDSDNELFEQRHENQKQREVIEELKQKLNRATESLSESRKNLEEAVLGRRAINCHEPIERQESVSLNVSYDLVGRRMAIGEESIDGVLCEVSPSRENILLDIAIGVLEGRVVGIDSTTISLLRG